MNIQAHRGRATKFASLSRYAGRCGGRIGAGVLCACAVLLALGASSPAQPPTDQTIPTTESQVKAAYLYNFGKFVRWPSEGLSNRSELNICILGKDPFGSVLDSTVSGESIDGRNIGIKRMSKLEGEADCSILYVSSSEQARLPGILAAARRSAMLTVSDIPRFADQGGVIGFVREQSRIRFEVNRRAAEQSRLVLSSELLKVAVRVIQKDVPVD